MKSAIDPEVLDSISVVMPLYNGKDVMLRAIQSVLEQTHPCTEIIIVDDGSTDGSREAILELAKEHPSINPILLDQNGGVSHARNIGFAAATGDWIAIIDADDAWHPDRMAEMLALAKQTGANYVMDNMMLYDINVGRNHRLMMVPTWDNLTVDQACYWDNCIIGKPQFSILKMLVSREFVQSSGLCYDVSCRYGEDLIYHAEALALGASMAITAKPLYIYSTRTGGYSKAANAQSQTKINFENIADKIDALIIKYGESIPRRARLYARKCASNFRVGHRLNQYRSMRQNGQAAGWIRLALDVRGILLMLRMRYRQYVTNRPPYLVQSGDNG